MTRKQALSRGAFIRGGLGAATLPFIGCQTLGDRLSLLDIPSTASPNYWCTWCTQDAALSSGRIVVPAQFDGDQGKASCSDCINEKTLFGEKGWVRYYPEVRSDLFFLLDEGWDEPYKKQVRTDEDFSKLGQLEPNPARFPSLGGDSAQKLSFIRHLAVDRGWRGLGVWVSPAKQDKEVWKRRFEVLAKGGVEYLKIDWGNNDTPEFRAWLTEQKRSILPHAIIEHTHVQGPTNGLHLDKNGQLVGTGRRFGDAEDQVALHERVESVLPFSDVWRIYDMMEKLQTVQAAERIAVYQELADRLRVKTVLSVEDRVYEGATLGCAFGVMRSPGLLNYAADDPERNGGCLVEVQRAVRWQRLAPAFGWQEGFELRHSEQALFDEASFVKGEHWCPFVKDGGRLRQGGPAVLARGLALPIVSPEKAGEQPFVMASRHPEGALSVGVMPRMTNGRRKTPPVTVRLDAKIDANTPLGVFGFIGAIDLGLGEPISRVLARDLAGGEDCDVTASCKIANGRLIIAGRALEDVCRARSADGSAPGVLVRVS